MSAAAAGGASVAGRPGDSRGSGGSSDFSDRREITDFVELVVTISKTIKDGHSRKWEVQVVRGELTVHDHGEIVSFATISESLTPGSVMNGIIEDPNDFAGW